ncbi:MAG: hypothetical protein JXA90_00445, partial [Planctomycetes bacterium]|nr:hypothetical protein [Planctomycetota bacterium]
MSLFCAGGLGPHLAAQDAAFRRGDPNADGAVDISDAIDILESLFLGGAPFPCADAADMSDDGSIDVTDAVHCVRFLFVAGAPPAAPHPGCGEDPTGDALSCLSHPPCESATDLCLSVALLEELIAPIPGFSFCLPAGLLELPLEAITVEICPSDLAQPCGVAEIDGCAVDLASFTPILDIPGRAVGLRVAGRIDDLPVRITESLFGTSA